ncbi:MAG: sensor histidine kinase, partial [Gemmatimonadota bacterium]
STLQAAVARVRDGKEVVWAPLLVDRFTDWYSCAIFTPAYIWLARRAPITRESWLGGVVAHLAATALFVVVKYAIYVGVGIAMAGGGASDTYGAALVTALARSFVYEYMILLGVAAAVHAARFYRRAQEREAHAARMRAELTVARMDALAAQLWPHFLFNALNSVSSLMHRDVEAADAVLARLGDLLRRTLRAGDGHEVPLAEELAVLDDYLAIVGARFRDRLTTDVRPEPGTERALVPRFVLQPLVENALKHGIARRAGAGRVEVRATRVGHDRLRLTVADDGAGRTGGERTGDERASTAVSHGVGLANTRRRLATLYGDAQRLSLDDRPGGGLVATVELPWREASPAPVGAGGR